MSSFAAITVAGTKWISAKLRSQCRCTRTRKPSGEKLTRIARALEVTTDYLLDESEEPSDQVLKEAFFRKFSKLNPEDQQKINQMIDMWGKKD